MYGQKIASIRTARGFTQEYMSKKLEIPQALYSKIENNKISKIKDEILEKIADVLGVTKDDITSPSPIIMSFNNSNNNNAPYGTQNISINEKIINELVQQLQNKDKQIDYFQQQLIIKDELINYYRQLFLKETKSQK